MPRSSRAWVLVFLAAAALHLPGCGSAPQPGDLPGEEGDFRRAERLYMSGRYLQAVEALDAYRNEHPGSDRIDDAIFLLGMSHQKQGENLLARDEFDRLLRDYPQSDHREEAQYERALAWLADSRGPALDPEPTEEALAAFRAYLALYPAGAHRAEAEQNEAKCLDRLALKAYLNGRTYLTAKHGDAAKIYFEKSLSIRAESTCAGDAMLGLVQAYRLLGDAAAEQAARQRLLDYATPERTAREPHLQKVRREVERGSVGQEVQAPGSR
jgi:outer membrane assembly lipoprotein YfiO